MINLIVKVYPRSFEVHRVDGVDFSAYHENPRFVADGVRVYMPRTHCGLSGRYNALCVVLMSELQDLCVPVSSLIDVYRRPLKKDRRPAWMKDAHARTRKLL